MNGKFFLDRNIGMGECSIEIVRPNSIAWASDMVFTFKFILLQGFTQFQLSTLLEKVQTNWILHFQMETC